MAATGNFFKNSSLVSNSPTDEQLVSTLKKLWSGIRRTATERVQFAAGRELVAETKVRDFYVQVIVHKKILSL